MERYLIYLVALVCGALPMPSLADNHPEQTCISGGKFAESAATLRQQGSAEQDLLSDAAAVRGTGKSASEKKRTEDAYQFMKRIVEYVYTMGYEPAEARKMVYLKCKAGDF